MKLGFHNTDDTFLMECESKETVSLFSNGQVFRPPGRVHEEPRGGGLANDSPLHMLARNSKPNMPWGEAAATFLGSCVRRSPDASVCDL